MTLRWVERDPGQACKQFADWLDHRPGASGANVTDWQMPKSGSSYETAFCRAKWLQNGIAREENLVVRIQPPNYSLFPDANIFLQSNLMTALAQSSNIPVPPVFWTEQTTDALGAPFFVMGKIAGNIPPDLISRRRGNFVEHLSFEERRELYAGGLAALADIHRVEIDERFKFLDSSLPGSRGLGQYLAWVENWYNWVAKGRRLEMIEAGLVYLKNNQPRDPAVGIIWGDARPGNIIFNDNLQPAAVIDWEMAALGPPEVDLGWWVMWETIWNAEGDRPEQEGFMDRALMLESYEAAAKRPICDFEYYELLAAVRLSIMMVIGVDKRVEAGILPASTTAGTHNLGSRLIASLLGLPIPEISADLGRLAAEMGDN